MIRGKLRELEKLKGKLIVTCTEPAATILVKSIEPRVMLVIDVHGVMQETTTTELLVEDYDGTQYIIEGDDEVRVLF
jgi:hypothetical protein